MFVSTRLIINTSLCIWVKWACMWTVVMPTNKWVLVSFMSIWKPNTEQHDFLFGRLHFHTCYPQNHKLKRTIKYSFHTVKSCTNLCIRLLEFTSDAITIILQQNYAVKLQNLQVSQQNYVVVHILTTKKWPIFIWTRHVRVVLNKSAKIATSVIGI